MRQSFNHIETKLSKTLALYGSEFWDFFNSFSAKFSELQKTLAEPSELEYYQWLNFDYLRKVNKETKDLASKIKAQNYENAILLGMGGSGINALVLKNALYDFIPKNHKKSQINLLIQNNLDPVSMLSKLESVNLDRTLFIVISKSGNTDEVTRNLSTLLDYWNAKLENFAKQAVFITEPYITGKVNYLHEIRAEILSKTGIEIPYLVNDPNIGGRFSLFSPVGMFPAELLGLNSDELLNGAASIYKNFLQTNQIQESNIATLALLDIFLSRRGLAAKYSMVYSDSLEALNKFRAQLKGESLNKNGIDSLLHIPGIGTVNHHSDLELLLKTNNGVLLEQVFFAKAAADHINTGSKLDKLSSLSQESNHQSLIDNHIDPLSAYILENQAPVLQTIIQTQDERSLAEFCMQDMLTTVLQAGFHDAIGSNEKLDLAIRQTEVERYKSFVRSQSQRK